MDNLISTSDIEKAKKLIKNSKKPVIVKAQDNEFNRKILEYGKFDILLSVEAEKKADSNRQIDSGLNHVLAAIASKNNISIGIDLKELRELSKEEKSLRLAKISQNIKICRKAGLKLILLNYKDKRTAFSFLISLGASTQQAREAISF